MPVGAVVSERDVPIRGLDPRHDGLRIAHLSDVHVGRFTPRAHVRAAVELAAAAKPDITALTGDYVCWSRTEIPLVEEWLAGLGGRRVVAVLGNHDYFTSGRGVAAALGRNGYDVLRNANTTIEVNGAPLTIVGIDDPITRHDDSAAAFEGARVGTRLVLVHYPVDPRGLVGRGAQLVLSGHTHGGQLNIPGVTTRMLRRVGIRYRGGLYDLDGARLYVTTGVGFVGVSLRAGEGTAAEVAVLTLRRV
jgi:hypothetical protein